MIHTITQEWGIRSQCINIHSIYTLSGRDLPENASEIIQAFVNDCKKHVQDKNLHRCNVISMDETSIYLNSPSSYTYITCGDNRVKAVMTGNEKTRVSIAFPATANGPKLNPVVLIPRVHPLPNYEQPDNVVVVYTKTRTFNDKIVQETFVQKVMIPFMLSHGMSMQLWYWTQPHVMKLYR